MLPKQKSVSNITPCYICYIILYRYINMGFCTIFMNGNHFLGLCAGGTFLPSSRYFAHILDELR